MRTIFLSLFTVTLLAFTAVPSVARADGAPVLSQHERQIILSYYRDLNALHTGGPRYRDPHAHRKHSKGLPPGILKNLRRGKPVPPGIAMHRLPAGLAARLPPPPRGYERIVLDGRVLLVDIATRVIHDVLVDAIIHD